MKKVLIVFSFWIMFFINSLYASGIPIIFGHYEDTYKIVDVQLKGPKNENLFLGYKTDSFYLEAGVYVQDKGYILGIEGENGSYYPLPQGDELKSYQEQGLLPSPLPQYNIPIQNYLIGYSLWILLFLFIAYYIGTNSSKNKEPVAQEQSTNNESKNSEEEIASQLKNDGFILISDTDKSQEWKNFDTSKIIEVEKLNNGKCKIKNEQNSSHSNIKQEGANKPKNDTKMKIIIGVVVAIILGIMAWQQMRVQFGKEEYDLGEKAEKQKDFELATKHYKKACEYNHADGCMKMGYYHSKGLGVEQDDEKSFNYSKQACEGGSPQGCANNGVDYEFGEGVKSDINIAFELYTKACNLDNAQGCQNLAWLYKEGNGVLKDTKKVLELFKKSCKLNEQYCSGLALMYEEGLEVKQSYKIAGDYYDKSCNKGYGIACTNLGNLYETVANDKEMAISYYTKGCDVGDDRGCKQLDRLNSAEAVPST